MEHPVQQASHCATGVAKWAATQMGEAQARPRNEQERRRESAEKALKATEREAEEPIAMPREAAERTDRRPPVALGAAARD